MRRRFAASEVATAPLWWIVSIRVAGVWRRYSSAPLEIEATTDSRWYRVSAGVTGASVVARAPWLGQAPEVRSASLAIVDAELDVPLLHSRRHRLDRQPVEVALWREGDTWEQRVVVLSGVVVGYRYGAPGEPLEVDAEESIQEDRALFPPVGAVISDLTWPDRPDGVDGAYPAPVGTPGLGPAGNVPATPAPFVESIADGGARDLLLVAAYPVAATSVWIFDGTLLESLALEVVADGRGQLVTVVDLAGAASIAVDPTVEYFAAWSQASLLSVTGTGGVAGAGSAIEAVLALSTLPIDRASLAAVRDYLDGWKVGAVVTEPMPPADWVAQALLPLLPVAALTGPEGWRLVPVRLDAQRADCVGTLRAERPSVVRDGGVTEEGRDQVANVLELRYALDLAQSEQSQTAKLSGAGWDGESHPTLQSSVSYADFGQRVRSEETVALYDETSAWRTLQWWAAAYSEPWTVIRYQCWGYAWVQAGDLLWLVDEELYLERPVWVQSIQWQDGGGQMIEVVAWRLTNAG